MKQTARFSVAAACIILTCAPDVARAGGFYVGDQGAFATGRAGAFTARADDLSAIYYNPAGLASLRGTRIYLSYRLAYTDMEYIRARTLDWSDAIHGVPRLVEFEPVTLENPVFPLGLMFAISSDFGLDNFTFAAGVFGPPAIGASNFPENGPQKYMMVSKDVILLYYTASAAWKYRDVFGIGLSLQLAHVPSMSFEMVVDGNIS
ncbi:MAG: outer membrane protein transport protein, partial [Myxococcota bacterium]